MRARALLTVLALLLAGAVWAERSHGVLGRWLLPPAESSASDDGKDAAEVVAALGSAAEGFVAPEVAPVESMSQTVERPLFRPDRRPPPLAVDTPTTIPTAAPPSAQPPQLVLTAVVITDLDRVALVRVNGGEELLRLREGQQVAGWELSAVSAEGITLTRGDARHEVALRTYQPSAPPPRARRRDARRREARGRESARDAETVARPRRALRGPRRRSMQRNQTQ